MATTQVQHPPLTKKAGGTRRSRAGGEIVSIVREYVREAEPEALEKTLAWWREHAAADSRETPVEKGALVQALTEGREYTPEETILLELEAQRQAFARRRELLRGALSSTQVAELLGTKRQTPHDRLRSQTLLAVEDNGRWQFPYWQFDASGPNGVIAGLPDVLKALDISALAKVSWLTTPNPYLEGRTPLQALKEGQAARVIDQARAVGVF
jgi:hypothetical protein